MNAKDYTKKLNLSEQMGHVVNLQGKLYVTVAGLRVLAQRADVVRIDCEPVWDWCEPSNGLFYVRCVVEMPNARTFTEYGCSDRSPVGKRGGNHALLGHASTRATGRALRLALEIELPLLEESGVDQRSSNQRSSNQAQAPTRKQDEIYRRLQNGIAEQNTTADLMYFRNVINRDKDSLHPTQVEYLREAYKERHKVIEETREATKKLQYKAYFAILKREGYTKEDSDLAIRRCFGVDSHADLSYENIMYMIRQVDDGYTGPPLSVEPEKSSMYQCHLEWARREREKASE